MPFTPLALGAGARLGTWGLRQRKDILEPVVTNITVNNALQIFFYSPSGETVVALSAGVGDGTKLEITWTEEKLGGLREFTITILRRLEIPFFNGMQVRFFLNNLAWALGFIKGIPDSDTDSETIEIKGVGFSEKLKDTTITRTYTNRTVRQVIEDVARFFPNIDIVFNATKLILPLITVSLLVFKNKSLFVIIETILKIVNFEFQDLEHVFGVDERRDFYFFGIQKENIKRHFFEGFDYQEPEVETTIDDIVNQVPVFRTKETNSKETEFVAIFSDVDSIDNFGLFERKLTVSDFLDNASIQKVAEAIIDENKIPRKRVSIKSLEPTRKLEYGFYALSNKKSFQRFRVSEFSDLLQWTQSLTTSTIAIQDFAVFTGRKCFIWELNSSLGDKISLSFDPIYGPEKSIIYLRHTARIEALKITFTTNTGQFTVNLKNLFLNDWIPYEFNFNNIFSLSNIEIEVISSGTVTILLDTLEIYTNSYFHNVLSLENITYTFNGKSLLADIDFGNKENTVISELTKINKKNGIPFEIFSKQ